MESMVGRLTFQHAQALEEITKFESFPVTLVFQVPKAQLDAQRWIDWLVFSYKKDGQSPCLMGKSWNIHYKWSIFHSYVKLPEGRLIGWNFYPTWWQRWHLYIFQMLRMLLFFCQSSRPETWRGPLSTPVFGWGDLTWAMVNTHG